MAHSPEHNPVSPEAIELGYQPEDLSVRGLMIFLVIFALGAVALHALLWWFMKTLEVRNLDLDAPRSALTIDQQPPAPNLQPSVGHDTLPRQDLEALRRREDAIFSKLGWTVNPSTHEVEIPPDIIRQVSEQAKMRAAAPPVPPTTTGKETNSIFPGRVPGSDTNPAEKGGTKP